jgi:hypothetical protein
MRRWLFAACLSLPGLAWADECKLAQVSRLTLQPSPEGFLVQAMFNDKPASLIFDTGSFTSILIPTCGNLDSWTTPALALPTRGRERD